jgi:pSer/pThr/pTyr-binding forkhead associated (FHA) protein
VAGAAAAGPRELTCPNCGTTNGIDENFCHDCGQDLRASRAALVTAAVAPPAAEAVVDIDTLPYLETLDRVDEQLEYVLSRPRVLIGTAQGNDIVINTDFMGYQSVSPVHAELRREPEGYLLRDRDSEQGTYVNDVRTGESLLADGDTFRLGGVRFVFRVPQGG